MLFFEGGKGFVGVGEGRVSRSEEVPVGGTFEGKSDDELTGFGAITAASDQLLNGDEVLSSFSGEGGEAFFIAWSDEAEMGISGIEEIVLVFGISKGSFGGGGETCLNDPLVVDDEAGGVSPSEEEAMGSGGEDHF